MPCVAIDVGTWGLVCFSHHPFPDREARMPTLTIEYTTEAMSDTPEWAEYWNALAA